jgi:short-subunit dehydrogenase
MKNLRGKNAIVTGASAGLGVEIARALAARGVNLALAARRVEPVAALAAELTQTGVKTVAVQADVNNAEDRERLVAAAEQALGPTDILINNAGVEVPSRFTHLADADLAEMMNTNVVARMRLARLVLPGMLARRRGHIVNHGSMSGKVPVAGSSVYSASNAAIGMWSRSLREELAGTGVSVSVVCAIYVTEVGVYAWKNMKAPFILREVTPRQVVGAFMTALERDRGEVLVAQLPIRPLLALAALSPWLESWILRTFGARKFMLQMAEKVERVRYGK